MDFVKDVFERTVGTYVQAVSGMMAAAGIDLINMPLGQALKVGGLVAVISFLKSLVGSQVGDPGTAAWLPSRVGRHG